MAAVADPKEESSMDKRELNFRYQARPSQTQAFQSEVALLDYKALPSVCGNLSQFLTVRR
jgi:hypothetical protein